MALLDPLTRLSPHFILADFLGNHSVYAKGMANGLDEDDPHFTLKWRNGKALCEKILEPLVENFGPVSISYGYISPAMSQRIVTYQDPTKPSHHRWDLGAAADVCVHNWVEGCEGADVTANSPAALAGMMIADDGVTYPLSRLITYSESPFICVACSAEEVRRFDPRMAIYENRYTGRPKVKPQFLRYNAPRVRAQFSREMQGPDAPDALAPHGWRGAGYPTHHGGGMQQYHHRRVSKYTMVSDWLFNLQTIANGGRNNPKLNDPRILDAFAAAGIVHDYLLDTSEAGHLSIVDGYVESAWVKPSISFNVVIPAGVDIEVFDLAVRNELPFALDLEYYEQSGSVLLQVSLEVDDVLNNAP